MESVSLGMITEDGFSPKLYVPFHPAGYEVPFIPKGCCRGKCSRVRGTAVADMLSSTEQSSTIAVLCMKYRVRTLVFLIVMSSKIYFAPAGTYRGRGRMVVGVRDINV